MATEPCAQRAHSDGAAVLTVRETSLDLHPLVDLLVRQLEDFGRPKGISTWIAIDRQKLTAAAVVGGAVTLYPGFSAGG